VDPDICSHALGNQDEPQELPMQFSPYAIHTPLHLPTSPQPSADDLLLVYGKRHEALQTVKESWDMEILRLSTLASQDPSLSDLLQCVRSFCPRIQDLLNACSLPWDTHTSMTRAELIACGSDVLKDLGDILYDEYIPHEVDEGNLLKVIEGSDDALNYTIFVFDRDPKWTWKSL
jgi:hypothetical protein